MKLTGFDISASALTAQRFRMDVITSNIANAETTRAVQVNGQWVPYRRKMVVMEPTGQQTFAQLLRKELNHDETPPTPGVKATQVVEDPAEFKRVYRPEHPDADADGYVLMPNVDIVKEMVDLLSATRSYEANVTALNASKAMFMKALEIGR
jgi:flagellar basal-body rod protein FlgC